MLMEQRMHSNQVSWIWYKILEYLVIVDSNGLQMTPQTKHGLVFTAFVITHKMIHDPIRSERMFVMNNFHAASIGLLDDTGALNAMQMTFLTKLWDASTGSINERDDEVSGEGAEEHGCFTWVRWLLEQIYGSREIDNDNYSCDSGELSL